MALHIFISHTGQRLLADPNQILSPDALRAWIAEEAGIPPSSQILMTTRGKNVKQQHILTEAELFVYDKRQTSGEDPVSTFNRSKPSLRRLDDPPSTIANENSLESWQELFMARRTWALEAADIVRTSAESAQVYNDEIEVITRSTAVALENLKTHVGGLQHKFQDTQKWANETLDEHRAALNDWKNSLNILEDVSIRRDLASILPGKKAGALNADVSRDREDGRGALRDLADQTDLESAAQNIEVASRDFENRLHELEHSTLGVVQDAKNVVNSEIGHFSWDGRDTANSLLEESETLAKRISTDYEGVLQCQNDPKSIASASRRALVHTRELLPALQTVVDEIQQLITSSVTRRNEAAEGCIEALREVSSLESRLAVLSTQVPKLDLDHKGTEALDTINKVFQLPVTYGSLLVEAARRTEWTKKIRENMKSLHEEVVSYKEEELKRRKKWAKSMGGGVKDLLREEDALLEINLSIPENTWPEIGRNEIHSYIDELRALGIDDAVQEVAVMLRGLESTEKARKRPLKAFKNGSVYDLSQSSLFPENGEAVKSLQDEKIRVEDKLRASDSRVRKLEDLLHRQSHLGRPNSGTFGGVPDFDRHSTSPTTFPGSRPGDMLSRKSSTASRRLSNQNPDEKALVQRIVSLEAENSKLQREAHAERRSSTENRDRMEEAESVKRDLMANFESQKQEFDDERQLLEDESQKLKIRIEEMEDELDRLAGSRDHQRMNAEEVIGDLQEQIDRSRKSFTEELTKMQNKFKTAESSLKTQRDRTQLLDRQIQQYKDERSILQTQNMTSANQLRDVEQQQQDYISTLQAAHDSLSPGGSAPNDLRRLVRAIEVLSEGMAIHARGLDDTLQLVTAESKSMEEKHAHAEAQAKRLEDRLAFEEALSTSLREALARERSKLASTQGELANEQEELQNLRKKFAAGETGSEALRESLAQELKHVGELTQKMAAAEAESQNAASEVEALKSKADSLARREQDLVSHLDARGSRAKELSEKMFQHNDRMIRMLEQFGYSVTRPDDHARVLIQRASKVNASTILLGSTFGDASASMKRTISGALPTQHFSETADLDTLYWMSDADADSEASKYDRFMSALSRLDLDATVEIITKRYKDVENSAKKYQKDSRGYREKSHRLQSEAHDKIAYRSFKEGDLALFLPTRNQATRPWAAFNVGAPHYFLREQDVHKLQTRDWLLARISRVEERVVDLSRSLGSTRGQHDRSSIHTDASDGGSTRSADDENPFELSDGLRWYMIDASEEKPGAPTTPGLGKSTVAASNIEVKGNMGKKVDKSGSTAGTSSLMVTKTLNKSLESRRSSSGSKKGHTTSPSLGELAPMVKASNSDLRSEPAREDAQVFDVDVVQPHLASPAKQSPQKPKPWEKIFGVDFKMEEGRTPWET